MHKSVHKSSVPNSYTLLFIVKSYLNVSVLMSDMYVYTLPSKSIGTVRPISLFLL